MNKKSVLLIGTLIVMSVVLLLVGGWILFFNKGLSQEKFLKIEVGMNQEEVVGLVGQGTEVYSEWMHDPNGSIFEYQFNDGNFGRVEYAWNEEESIFYVRRLEIASISYQENK